MENKGGKGKIGSVFLGGLVIVTYVLVVTIFKIGCPIRYIFHIPCPVCGLTRAALSLLRGDFGLAFTYHPLVLFIPVWLMVLFGRDTSIAERIGKKVIWGFLYFGAVIIFLVYLVRLILGIIV